MSQASEVESQLRKMILRMDLGPGERLTERWAEASFNASRTPVRAALQKLESEGLVCRDGLRWMVAPIDIKEVEQLCIYREVLEVAAVRLSANLISKEQLDSLEALFVDCDQDDSEKDLNDPGSQFHLQLAGFCGNTFIIEGIEDSLKRLSRARWLDKEPTNPAWKEHVEIVSALRDQETDKAAALLSRHLSESRKRLLESMNLSRRSLRASGIIITS
ncbi:GntR family transcriptional regulator [Klebsiella michiganensis]|uniref:GntR family transcriptional regulator n=1 Tax=Klebsiella michiganensis TaxID=1134687 RepID=UPI00136F8290|nr:GntR family transcriptional regulator [Klebsiella michiganensis]MXJ79430.1 FCD domain-containing protein [Klebsiella michiganensis]